MQTSLFSCLESSFPGIQKAIHLLNTLGYPWEKISRPFVITKNNQVVAHAGLIEVAIMVEGLATTYASIHAVCTHPDYRHNGLGTKVMNDAISYAQSRYENVILFTRVPFFYERLGFKRVQEHYFHAHVSPLIPKHVSEWESRPGERTPLHADNPSDLKSLKKHLATHIPLSSVFSLLSSDAINVYNMLSTYPRLKDIYYIETIDTVVSCSIKGTTLKLYDLFCPKPVSLDLLLECFVEPISEIFFYFSPDRFKVDTTPNPYTDPDDVFMSLSPEKLPKTPFMMPFLSRS